MASRMDKADLPSAEDYAAERARFGALDVIDIDALQRGVSASYSNRVLVDINGECLRLAVFEGEYRWHFHPATDELFVVVAGSCISSSQGAPRPCWGRCSAWWCLPARCTARARSGARSTSRSSGGAARRCSWIPHLPADARYGIGVG